MDFLPPKIEAFSEDHTTEETALLYDLNRQTHIQVMIPRMLSGHMQGRILSLFSKMIQPKNILEIGTYTGYSALCLAEGIKPDGKLITIDKNEELEEFTQSYFDKSDYSSQIDFRIGNAVDLIPNINLNFDLVFIDADKSNYLNYFDLVIDKTNKGGYIIADNVLWSGKVVEPIEPNDKDTKAMVDYCDKIHNDPRVENILMPVRDGLMIARKL
jgi:predicted O-methyltransferase YrrM